MITLSCYAFGIVIALTRRIRRFLRVSVTTLVFWFNTVFTKEFGTCQRISLILLLVLCKLYSGQMYDVLFKLEPRLLDGSDSQFVGQTLWVLKGKSILWAQKAIVQMV